MCNCGRCLTFPSVDGYAILPDVTDREANNPYLRFALPDSVPEIYDIPIGMVNRVLYFDKDEEHKN